MPRRRDEFERIALSHTRSLLGVARRLTWDTAAAEDLVQETMLSAWRGFHQFRAGTSARAWLFRIMINGFHARGRKTQPMLGAAPRGRYAVRAELDFRSRAQRGSRCSSGRAAHRSSARCGRGVHLSANVGTVMSRTVPAREANRLRLAPRISPKFAGKTAYEL